MGKETTACGVWGRERRQKGGLLPQELFTFDVPERLIDLIEPLTCEHSAYQPCLFPVCFFFFVVCLLFPSTNFNVIVTVYPVTLLSHFSGCLF